jgi:adenylyltransferase/sulfurtransferase
VEVKGATVGEAMNDLVAQHPELRRHLYGEDGKLRAFVNLYLNDEDIRYLQKEATAVKDGDDISIVPSIAGGTENSRSSVVPSGARDLGVCL